MVGLGDPRSNRFSSSIEWRKSQNDGRNARRRSACVRFGSPGSINSLAAKRLRKAPKARRSYFSDRAASLTAWFSILRATRRRFKTTRLAQPYRTDQRLIVAIDTNSSVFWQARTSFSRERFGLSCRYMPKARATRSGISASDSTVQSYSFRSSFATSHTALIDQPPLPFWLAPTDTYIRSPKLLTESVRTVSAVILLLLSS